MPKSTIHKAHDRLFRAAITYPQVARDFLELYLPEEIKKEIDFNHIELCPVNFISAQLQESEADGVFKVRMAAKEAYLFILAEHQSTVDELMPLRLFHYMIGIWKNHCQQQSKNALPLPPIFPFVFFTNDGPYTGMRTLWELCGPNAEMMRSILDSPFHLIDVNEFPENVLLANPKAGTLGFVFRKDFREQPIDQLKLITNNLKKIDNEVDRNYLYQLLYYILSLQKGQISVETFFGFIRQELSPEAEEKMMTFADELIEQGRVEGERRGELRGELRGERKGELKGRMESAKGMLKEGISLRIIAKITKLPIAKIKALLINEEIY